MKFLREEVDAIIDKVEEDDRCADTDKVGVKKMQAFKQFAKKGLNFTRKHVLPHLADIRSNVLMDVMEGKKVGQSIKSNARQHARNELR